MLNPCRYYNNSSKDFLNFSLKGFGWNTRLGNLYEILFHLWMALKDKK